MDSGVREARTWTGFDQLGKGSLIDRMTAEAQAARDAFDYGKIDHEGRTYKLDSDWVAQMERHAAKYGTEATT